MLIFAPSGMIAFFAFTERKRGGCSWGGRLFWGEVVLGGVVWGGGCFGGGVVLGGGCFGERLFWGGGCLGGVVFCHHPKQKGGNDS